MIALDKRDIQICHFLIECRSLSESKLFDAEVVFLKKTFKKVDFGESQQMTKKHVNLPSMQQVKYNEQTF